MQIQLQETFSVRINSINPINLHHKRAFTRGLKKNKRINFCLSWFVPCLLEWMWKWNYLTENANIKEHGAVTISPNCDLIWSVFIRALASSSPPSSGPPCSTTATWAASATCSSTGAARTSGSWRRCRTLRASSPPARGWAPSSVTATPARTTPCARTAGTASSATARALATGDGPASGVSGVVMRWVRVGETCLGSLCYRGHFLWPSLCLRASGGEFFGFTAFQMTPFLGLDVCFDLARIGS